MGVKDEVPYADAHCRDVAERADEEGFAPFMHLGEFVEEASRAPPIGAASFERAQRALTDRVIALVALPDRARVLEVGCGFGGNLAVLDEAGRAETLVGLDIGPRQLELARRVVRPRSGARIEWVLADACALPFPDACFDTVLAIECAFHFSSRLAFAAEARRVLRPGGRLVLTDLVGAGQPVGGTGGAGGAGSAAELIAVEELAAILRADLGPCPDLTGPGGGWAAIAAAAGLRPLSREDITAAVLPSFDHILQGKPRDPRAHRDPNDRGAAALLAALTCGLLRAERWAFERPGLNEGG